MPDTGVLEREASRDDMRTAARGLLSRGNGLDLETAAGVLALRAGRKKIVASPVDWRVALDGTGASVWLALRREQGESPLGDLHWQDYEGEARLLAWSLAHEELVAALSHLFGGALLPSAFQPDLPDERLWLELHWRDPSGRRLEGWLGLSNEAMRQLASVDEWKRDPRRLSVIGDVDTLRLNLVINGRALDAAAVAGLAPGDVLVVGTEDECEGRLQPEHDTTVDVFGLPDGWPVRWQQPQWLIANPPALSVATEPLRPQFLLAGLSLALEQIDRLQPGSVAVAGAALVGSTVGIVLHGRRFGEGVLVGMGAWLGVRITHMEPQHGLR